MDKAFWIPVNLLKKLIATYANHKLICEEYELDEDPVLDFEYDIHHSCCETAENWMRAFGIDPMSNFVTDIIEKEREARA